MTTLSRISLVLAAAFALTSCDRGFTADKFKKVGYANFKTEQEIVAFLGAGSEVKDSYTESIITEHKLPASARFLRYSDPAQPGIYYHVVLVDGKLREKNTWDTRKKPRFP